MQKPRGQKQFVDLGLAALVLPPIDARGGWDGVYWPTSVSPVHQPVRMQSLVTGREMMILGAGMRGRVHHWYPVLTAEPIRRRRVTVSIRSIDVVFCNMQ